MKHNVKYKGMKASCNWMNGIIGIRKQDYLTYIGAFSPIYGPTVRHQFGPACNLKFNFPSLLFFSYQGLQYFLFYFHLFVHLQLVYYQILYSIKDELNGLRVSCAVCRDFDLCPECFACGAEIGSHKNNHKYYVGSVK